ncbi:hypothetical protein BFS06_13705 [Clostridium perfringens]|uniref:Uncharacterized protein n=1 Tax=Clostridium perfringens TaxID=1502 RepID=A0A140GRT1_CLOPF|nr:hypothetical protein [Clostridium perfringens]AMN31240.1 hypothetical protein JFP838_pA0324 [Clostridium perfringens]TBX14261.1 hypothetical protein BFS06_13705 [Clostridium perfringens]
MTSFSIFFLIMIIFGITSLIIGIIELCNYYDNLMDVLTYIILGVVMIICSLIFIYKDYTNSIQNKYIATQFQTLLNKETISNTDLEDIKKLIKNNYDINIQIIDNNCLTDLSKVKDIDVNSKDENNYIREVNSLNNKGNDKFIKIEINENKYMTIYKNNFKITSQ